MRQSIVCLAVLVFSLPIAAATSTTTLQGTVVDGRGNPVDRATVHLVDDQRGNTRSTTSDGGGRFVIAEVAPGGYRVEVVADGFTRKRVEGLLLEIGQTYRLDVTLEPLGVVSDTVDAVAAAPTLATVGRSTVDGVIGATEIESLPLNGRNFLELSFLIPGNVPTPSFDPTKSNTVVVSSAGQSGRSSMVTVDGADNNDDVVGGPLQNLPQDAVQEFQIATNRYSAATGRSGSATINVVTRSGTDQLRGSTSLFARDADWQARSPVDESDDEPPFERRQYSLALGGPIQAGASHWFGALEYRDQFGGVLVGERDLATRTIRRSFADAPLEDLLGSFRFDWNLTDRDHVMARVAFEDAEDTGASTLDRAIGAASQRQTSANEYQAAIGRWDRATSSTLFNSLSMSFSRFRNEIVPVEPGAPQLTFPSIQGGASFRVPQGTDQDRLQLSESLTWLRNDHALEFGVEIHRVEAAFDLGVFQAGRIELIQDFAQFDHNGDGLVDDRDLLFAVTLRSGFPDRNLVIDDIENTYVALYAQDDWWVTPQLTLNLGLRWETDSNVNNKSGYGQRNPLVEQFYDGDRDRDLDNFGPRLGFSWVAPGDRLSVHGGWGIYYDRITLQITSLERGLDGRALPIEVRAGNAFFVDPQTGQFPPFAPSIDDPFTGFILPGEGASGINIIDNDMETPEVQQWNLGIETRLGRDLYLRADGIYNRGTNFIIGRTVGEVFNPVVGGPDRVVNLESSVGTKYRGLLLSLDRRAGRHRFRASYTLSKSENYANDDQIPFSEGPLDPNDLEREFGASPFDRRHRLTFAGHFALPGGFTVAPLLTYSTGVPMDILMPDGSMRVPTLERNAGGRRFDDGAELNRYLRDLNSAGGIDGVLLPLVDDDADLSDDFFSLDVRFARTFSLPGGRSIEAILEILNLTNTTNILGVSTTNYSGYSNVLTRDSEDPQDPGYLKSSSFGKPVTTAGGVFGSGGPRAVQLGVRFAF